MCSDNRRQIQTAESTFAASCHIKNRNPNVKRQIKLQAALKNIEVVSSLKRIMLKTPDNIEWSLNMQNEALNRDPYVESL